MKRTKTGIVTSNKMDKTVVVTVTEHKVHEKYKKRYVHSTKFYAHTDEDIAEGTRVLIEETRPVSKTKCWKVVEVYSPNS